MRLTSGRGRCPFLTCYPSPFLRQEAKGIRVVFGFGFGFWASRYWEMEGSQRFNHLHEAMSSRSYLSQRVAELSFWIGLARDAGEDREVCRWDLPRRENLFWQKDSSSSSLFAVSKSRGRCGCEWPFIDGIIQPQI